MPYSKADFAVPEVVGRTTFQAELWLMSTSLMNRRLPQRFLTRRYRDIAG